MSGFVLLSTSDESVDGTEATHGPMVGAEHSSSPQPDTSNGVGVDPSFFWREKRLRVGSLIKLERLVVDLWEKI